MRLDRLDKGDPIRPTVSTDPDAMRLYDGPRRQNLFTKEHKHYSEQGRINYDHIFRGGDGETEKDFMD